MRSDEAFPFIRMKTELLCWLMQSSCSLCMQVSTLESTPAQFAWGCQSNNPINWHRRVKLAAQTSLGSCAQHVNVHLSKATLKIAKLSEILPVFFRTHLQVYSSCLGKETEWNTTALPYICWFGTYWFYLQASHVFQLFGTSLFEISYQLPLFWKLKCCFLFLIFPVERENVQKRTFTRWINLHLGKVRLTVLILRSKDTTVDRMQLIPFKIVGIWKQSWLLCIWGGLEENEGKLKLVSG